MFKKTLEFIFADPITSGALTGLLLAVVLIISVFATGQTFGQRCKAVYGSDSVHLKACVNKLSRGLSAW